MRASVIICTHNRAALLKEAINSILQQDFPHEQFEMIIVDNNSSDNTREVVSDLCREARVPVRYVFEESPGLAYARNRGIQEARGEIVAYIDDDVVAERQWLGSLASAYDNPDVGCAGGRNYLLWLGERPDWLTPDMEHYLSKLDYGDSIVELQYPQIPYGCNISFRKSIFKKIGFFSTHLNLIGGKQNFYNDEANLCYRLNRGGIIIRYVPNAIIYHKVPSYRLKKQWFYHRAYWQGRSDAVFFIENNINVYDRLRQSASEILGRKEEDTESEKECSVRWFKGYLHQLLLSGDLHEWNGHGRMRALETLLAEVMRFVVITGSPGTLNVDLVRNVTPNNMWVGGLGDPEGPYPQWELPLVRWAKKSRVKIDFFAEKQQEAVILTMSFRPQVRPSASMAVIFNGVGIKVFELSGSETWHDVSLDLISKEGWNSIELCFETGDVMSPTPDDPLYMLFRELTIKADR